MYKNGFSYRINYQREIEIDEAAIKTHYDNVALWALLTPEEQASASAGNLWLYHVVIASDAARLAFLGAHKTAPAEMAAYADDGHGGEALAPGWYSRVETFYRALVARFVDDHIREPKPETLRALRARLARHKRNAA